MINKLKTLCLVTVFFSSCNTAEDKKVLDQSASEIRNEDIVESEPIKTAAFMENATKKAQDLIAAKKYTPFLTLQQQKLDKIEENSGVSIDTSQPDKMSGNQLYYFLKERTMYIGSSYLCDLCPNIHLMNASGHVINGDGVIVTNYHVIEVNDDIDISGVFAADSDGNVYPVIEVLAASQSNDLAILKIDTNGKKLKHIPFAKNELMGENIYLMGHPYNDLFFMSKGIISRKYRSDRDYEVKIGITAEFGPGASGGPIVNEHGQLIGMVSGVKKHNASGKEGHAPALMLSREAIPVSVLHEYIRQN